MVEGRFGASRRTDAEFVDFLPRRGIPVNLTPRCRTAGCHRSIAL